MEVTVSLDNVGLFFAGSPIIAKVSVTGYPVGSTMRRAYIRVTGNGAFREYKWDADTDSNGDHSKAVDISSAVRSLLDDYRVLDVVGKSGEQTLPKLAFSVVAYVTYMQDGVTMGGFSSGGTGFQSSDAESSAIHGALTDMERRKLGSADALASKTHSILLSRKPTEVEVVMEGQPYPIVKIQDAGDEGDVPTLTMESIDSLTRNIYKVSQNTRVFLFRNSLGVPETICATTLEQENVNLKSEQYGRVSMPSFAPSSRRIQQVSSHYISYEMSSGNVTLPWARWWANEFLAAKEWWLLKDGEWIPVTIKAKSESINILDRSKAAACHVDFTVTVALDDDIEQSLF